MSLLDKYPCDNITAPTYLSFSSASFTILSAVVATVGNFLVVLAVFLDPNKDLRSPFNYFVANLALADLIVGLLTSPLAAIYLISEGLKHPNQQFRVWMHMTYFISCTASLLSLTALALDRYVAIAYPLLYRTKLSPVRASLVLLLVWIVSILFSLIYFIVGYNKFRSESVCICVEITRFPEGFQEYFDIPGMCKATEIHFGIPATLKISFSNPASSVTTAAGKIT
ncbi:hypothetical protein ACROYT_G022842 [Oculina patagonica]